MVFYVFSVEEDIEDMCTQAPRMGHWKMKDRTQLAQNWLANAARIYLSIYLPISAFRLPPSALRHGENLISGFPTARTCVLKFGYRGIGSGSRSLSSVILFLI